MMSWPGLCESDNIKPRPICGGKMMSKKKPRGHEKGWFGSIQN